MDFKHISNKTVIMGKNAPFTTNYQLRYVSNNNRLKNASVKCKKADRPQQTTTARPIQLRTMVYLSAQPNSKLTFPEILAIAIKDVDGVFLPIEDYVQLGNHVILKKTQYELLIVGDKAKCNVEFMILRDPSPGAWFDVQIQPRTDDKPKILNSIKNALSMRFVSKVGTRDLQKNLTNRITRELRQELLEQPEEKLRQLFEKLLTRDKTMLITDHLMSIRSMSSKDIDQLFDINIETYEEAGKDDNNQDDDAFNITADDFLRTPEGTEEMNEEYVPENCLNPNLLDLTYEPTPLPEEDKQEVEMDLTNEPTLVIDLGDNKTIEEQ